MTETLSFDFPDLSPEQQTAAPRAFLTTLAAGKMRFSWREENPHRDEYFARILPPGKTVVPIGLIHSKNVFLIERREASEFEQDDDPHKSSFSFVFNDGLHRKPYHALSDGLITVDRSFVPSVTVADCMPLWMYDPVTGVFGVIHSGWKGTGIAAEAVKFAQSRFNARPQDIRFIIGPHIEPCCYYVDAERAGMFVREYGPECVPFKTVRGYALSLTEANRTVLLRAGVTPEHILIKGGCTCCSEENGEYLYGSFRREGAVFSRMAAYVM